MNMEAPAQRVVFQRMPTAPSVPARNQSYGYEEGRNGELVMQGAEENTYTGVGADTVGPAMYNPNDAISALATDRRTDFAKNDATRKIFSISNTPGPGKYNTGLYDNSFEKMKVPKGKFKKAGVSGALSTQKVLGPRTTSNFASKVTRFEDEKGSEVEMPGPGSYSHMDQFQKSKEMPKGQQGFGSKQVRGFNVDITKQRAAPTWATTPGPGSYVETRNSFSDFHLGARGAAFTSSTTRFGSKDKNMPGPGTYDEENESGFINDLGKKVTSTNGIFGSTTTRFASHKSQESYMYLGTDETPGPGDYKAVTSFREGRRKFRRPGSMFTSTTDRFTGKGKSNKKPQDVDAGPPPGAYEMQDPWNWERNKYKQIRKGGAFVSTAQRFTRDETKNVRSPGPGAYTPRKTDHRPLVNRTCFISKESRFKGSTTLTPGPGTYANEDSSSMLKRSYNVSIDGVDY